MHQTELKEYWVENEHQLHLHLHKEMKLHLPKIDSKGQHKAHTWYNFT
jgi:hypothetical protein